MCTLTLHAGCARRITSHHRYINESGRPLLVEDSDQGHGLAAPRGLPDDPDGWCVVLFFSCI